MPPPSEVTGRFININNYLCRTETEDGSFRPSDVFAGRTHGWGSQLLQQRARASGSPLPSASDSVSTSFVLSQYMRQLTGAPAYRLVTTEAGDGRRSVHVEQVPDNPLALHEDPKLSGMGRIVDCPIVNAFGVLSGGALVACTEQLPGSVDGDGQDTLKAREEDATFVKGGHFVDFTDEGVIRLLPGSTQWHRLDPTREDDEDALGARLMRHREVINEVMYCCSEMEKIMPEAILSLHSSINPLSGVGSSRHYHLLTPTMTYPVRGVRGSSQLGGVQSLRSLAQWDGRAGKDESECSSENSEGETQKKPPRRLILPQRRPRDPGEAEEECVGCTAECWILRKLRIFRNRCERSGPQESVYPAYIPFNFQLHGIPLEGNPHHSLKRRWLRAVRKAKKSVLAQTRPGEVPSLQTALATPSPSRRRESFICYAGDVRLTAPVNILQPVDSLRLLNGEESLHASVHPHLYRRLQLSPEDIFRQSLRCFSDSKTEEKLMLCVARRFFRYFEYIGVLCVVKATEFDAYARYVSEGNDSGRPVPLPVPRHRLSCAGSAAPHLSEDEVVVDAEHLVIPGIKMTPLAFFLTSEPPPLPPKLQEPESLPSLPFQSKDMALKYFSRVARESMSAAPVASMKRELLAYPVTPDNATKRVRIMRAHLDCRLKLKCTAWHYLILSQRFFLMERIAEVHEALHRAAMKYLRGNVREEH